MKTKIALLVTVWAMSACSLASAGPIQWTVASGGNDHFYLPVTDRIPWLDAKAAASAMTYNGFQGYLATATSLQEVLFMQSLLQPVLATNGVSPGFSLGGSDAASEGNWQWVTGPDVGTPFFFAPHQYPWVSIQPDNSGGQNFVYALIADGSQGTIAGNFYLDDISSRDGSPGYLVEFGGTEQVPEPSTIALIGMALLSLFGFGLMRRRADT